MTTLLEVDKVTVRFGGLTAVSAVDLGVNEGEVFAVIGPNGAGKTTLFNAIAGIYEPTEGDVRFEGASLARPLERTQWIQWGLTGLSIATFLLLFVSNVDALWSVTVKQAYGGAETGFDFRQASRDFVAHLAAKPRIEHRLGRFTVSSYDGTIPLGSVETRAEADALRESLPSNPAEDAVRAESGARTARGLRIGIFLLGLVLGTAGGYAVWRQTRRAPAWIASRGIARTFQNIRLFKDMTVLENVLVAMDRHLSVDAGGKWTLARLPWLVAPVKLAVLFAFVGVGRSMGLLGDGVLGVLLVLTLAGALVYVAAIWRLGAFSPHALSIDAAARDEARKVLEFVGLDGKREETSKNLAYGDQRRLEIARALATKPKLLLLDEPAAGMNPAEAAGLTDLVRKIRERGVTVLLIEHHMRVVMGISDRIAVLEYGRKIAEGTPAEIRENPKVIEAYLGKDELG